MNILTRTFDNITGALGLDTGTVSEKNIVVDREIESKPIEKNQKESSNENRIKTGSRPAISTTVKEEDDCTLIVGGQGKKLFTGKETAEERTARIEAAEKQKNIESIERSRRRVLEANARSQEAQRQSLYIANPIEFNDKVYDEICYNLRQGLTVICSYENIKRRSEKLKIDDTVIGCCRALGCKVSKVSNETFVITPSSARICSMSENENFPQKAQKNSFFGIKLFN